MGKTITLADSMVQKTDKSNLPAPFFLIFRQGGGIFVSGGALDVFRIFCLFDVYCKRDVNHKYLLHCLYSMMGYSDFSFALAFSTLKCH